jgi:hypothetical protein
METTFDNRLSVFLSDKRPSTIIFSGLPSYLQGSERSKLVKSLIEQTVLVNYGGLKQSRVTAVHVNIENICLPLSLQDSLVLSGSLKHHSIFQTSCIFASLQLADNVKVSSLNYFIWHAVVERHGQRISTRLIYG